MKTRVFWGLLITIVLMGGVFTSFAAEYSRYLKNYSVEDGLSQSMVNQIVQDDFGYLWIATEYGLNRFDGYTFEEIPGPENRFASDGIVFLLKLGNGKIFVSTYFNGAYLLSPESLAVEKVFSGKLTEISSESMSVDFAYEFNNVLWLAIGQRLVKYDLANQKLNIVYTLENDEHGIRAITHQENTLLLATSLGLKRYDIATATTRELQHLPKGTKQTIDNANTKSFLRTSNGDLLIGTVQGLYRYNVETESALGMLIPELNIWSMIAVGDEVLVGTQKGLFSLDMSSIQLTSVATFSDIDPLITDNNVKHVFRDKSGLIWLSSQIKGFFSFDPQVRRFSSFSRLSKLKISDSTVFDYLEAEAGIYWVGTGNGLNKIDSNTGEVEIFFSSEDEKATWGRHTIYRIFPQSNGKYWLWHAEGLTLFDPKSGTVVPSSIEPTLHRTFVESYPSSLFQVTDSQFVFLTSKGHFLLDLKLNIIKPLARLNKDFNPEASASFLPSFSGSETVLLATTGGLIEYDFLEDTYKTRYKIEDFHFHDYKYVSDWKKDAKGHIWLAVNGIGVVELDKNYKVLRTLGKSEGLKDIRLNALNLDSDDNLWVSSQSGMYLIDKKGDIQLYSATDGLISSEVYEVARRFDNGHIAFNTAAGLLHFDPKNVQNFENELPKVKLVEVAISSQMKTLTPLALSEKTLELGHDDFGLSFSFSTFDFAQQHKLLYHIELIGKDAAIFENYRKNMVEFNKLEPGHYTLKIQAKTSKNGALSEPEILKFEVNYNPLTSPVAVLAYICFFAVSFGIFYLRRVKQQAILQRAHDQLLNEQQKSTLALSASNSGIWSFDKLSGESVQQRLIELGHPVSEVMNIRDFFTYIHPDDGAKLGEMWRLFIDGKIDHWDVSYRVRNSNDKWVWYRDLGKASASSAGNQPVLFTGTYTNVNTTKASELQAQLYGQALRKMNEWLLILDDKLVPVTSNPAFNKRFISRGEKLTIDTINHLFTRRQLEQYISNIRQLSLEQKFIHEDVVKVPAGFDIPVLISISAIGDETIDNYVIVISDLSEQKKVENKLKYLANFDSLTHLANRSLIRDRIEQAILHNGNNQLALLFIDLDRFKQVNDVYGHAAGDQLLVEVAYRLNAIVGDKDSVGRQSGDEFIVLMEDIVCVDEVSRCAEKLTISLAQPYLIDNKVINISSSTGIALYPNDAADCEELMQNADIAMLHAKQRGRNCYRFFTDEMNAQMTNRVLLENDFVQAVYDNALTNYYQPIVDIERQEVVGAELLLRWFNNEQMISPAVFIPIAESLGHIIKITEQALIRALDELGHWLNGDRYLSINLSAIHIVHPVIVESLLSIVQEKGASPSKIRLEITEGVLIDDTDIAKNQLRKLREAGFHLFLDDFGTGYSSLTYINQFPIDVIKVDQCFVRQMIEDKTSRAIVQTIANLAHNIDSYCVVEGVEELEQVAILKQLGCETMQGYFFAKPMNALDLLSEETNQCIAGKLTESDNL
ncbi:MAG: EAL domain-containing protein [Psychrobium sp.]